MKPRPYDFKLKWYDSPIDNGGGWDDSRGFWTASLMRGSNERWAVKVSGVGNTPDQALDDLEAMGRVKGLL